MEISRLNHAASVPALLRFAFRVATHAQGWLPAGWLAFTGRASNPLDHYEEFQIMSSPLPVLLTLQNFSPSGIPISIPPLKSSATVAFQTQYRALNSPATRLLPEKHPQR
jgi:hypothetical protein